MRKRVGSTFRFTSQIILLTLLTFFILNLIAYVVFQSTRSRTGGLTFHEYFVPPLSPPGLTVLKEQLPAQAAEAAIRLLASDPGIRPHPVLGFTEGLSTPGYHVGIESIRYEEGWSDAQVESWLGQFQGASFVMGGSTAFGHGVEGSQTISAELNRLDPAGNYLNTAIQAYDSIREVDRLLHLLRLGYRPKRVVFVDGLNDLTTFAWSPYRAQDKPRTQTLILDRGETALILGHPRANNMLRALTFSLPVAQLLHHWQWKQRFQNYPIREARVDLEMLDWQELMYYYTRWSEFQPARADQLAAEWIDYYTSTVDFVQRLGHEFGFQSTFVLQPLGPAIETNPFFRKGYLESSLYQLYSTFLAAARKAVVSGRLPITDCSSALDGSADRSFVDVSHYSPEGNRLVARCIHDEIGASMKGDVAGMK